MNDSNKKEDIEMLDISDDFENTTTLDFDNDVETLDFDVEKKVSSEIDKLLDFSVTEEKTSEDLNKVLENNNDNNISINANKLEEYKPSIKDFKIKSAKTRLIVKKSMLYVVIIMLIGFEFFITKTGNILNDLKVYGSDNQPIKIIQNDKYGYIDSYGEKVVNPKYIYAEDFVNGYAIVRNSSNLPLIINKGGKEVVPSGTYFSIYRADKNIICSKATKAGLKYGVLDPNLREIIPFNYDSINYLGNIYSFVNENTVGIINSNGKEIFTYKLTNNDSKVIKVNKSNVSDGVIPYGVVTVNKTSQIVNLETGKSSYSPTLNKIVAEDNNVFYEITKNSSKKYMYVQDDKVLVESESYKSMSVKSITSGVIKAINDKYGYEFISTSSLEQIKKGLNNTEAFEGDNVFMYIRRNYKKNFNEIVLIKNGKEFKTIDGNYEVYKGFKNGFAVLKLDDGKYAYINESGNFINDDRYIEAGEFDSYGDAVAKKESGYGVISKDGKTKLGFEYNEIKSISENVKLKLSSESKAVFYAAKKENRYILYNSKGKKVSKTYYNNIEFNADYPVFKASTNTLDLIITNKDLNEIKLTSFNTEYETHDNYIIVKDEYYNYDGKLIHTLGKAGE